MLVSCWIAYVVSSDLRVLASFPIHPVLLFLSGLSRPLQTEADPVRSAEEFDACIHHAPDYGMTLDRVLWAFGWFRGAELLQQAPLAMAVDRAMGHLHLQLASDISELGRASCGERVCQYG